MSVGAREPGCHPEPAAASDAYTLAIDLDEALTVLASPSERKRDIYALKACKATTELAWAEETLKQDFDGGHRPRNWTRRYASVIRG